MTGEAAARRALSPAATLALVTVLVSIAPFSWDVYLPSMPAMAAELGTSRANIQLTLSVFLFSFALLTLLIGPLSDRFGRRPVLLGALSIYVVTSGLGAAAPDIATLLAIRPIQAAGAATGIVVGRAIVRDVFERERIVRAYGIVAGAVALAPMMAPMIGGQIEVLVGWRGSFVLMAAIGLFMLVSVWGWLGETNRQRNPAATRAGPLVGTYAALLGQARYLGYALSNSFAYAGVFSFISGSAFVLVELYGLAPDTFGLLFGLAIGSYGFSAWFAGALARRIGVDALILICAVLTAAVAGAMAALALAGGLTVVALVIGSMLYNLALGGIFPSGQAGAIGPNPQRAGAASALLIFMQMSIASGFGAAMAQIAHASALPMLGAMTLAPLCLCASFWLLIWRRRGRSAGGT